MEKTITKIETLPKLEKKIRVAAYARVSSGKDAMLHSLSAQVSFYNKLIQQNKKWQFAGVYSDEAITGTKSTREGFQNLLNDCREGKVDMIITKSISRFARNTVTLLETVRELKKLNIDVYFEEQNLHTLSSDGELILTFLASFAQEEAKSTSDNMKWRIKRDFEQGQNWGYKPCLGYKVENRKYVVEPDEAKLVKRIFDLYLAGNGDQKIANILNNEGVKTYTGLLWRKVTITQILSNISYTGDIILQKTYRVDYLNKITKRNKGERNQYYCENDHEAIISREVFEKAQEIRKARRSKIKYKTSPTSLYPLAGLIKCGVCGDGYRHKMPHNKEVWICQTFNTKGKAYCSSQQIPQDIIYDAINQVLGTTQFDETYTRKMIDKIIAQPGQILEFHLKDGTIVNKEWKHKSRKDSWTPEMKEKARKKANLQYGKDDE